MRDFFRNIYWQCLFLEGPERFAHPERHGKISNIMITELFYSHMDLIWTDRSVHTRRFRGIDFSVLGTNELELAQLRTRKVSGTFEKQAPGNLTLQIPI